ncbi:MAG: CPBP family glutamic-type intramembrane protease [Candidatus Saccharimonadales bacterium]
MAVSLQSETHPADVSRRFTTHDMAKYLSLVLLIIGTILTIPLENKMLGYALLATGALLSIGSNAAYFRHIILVFVSIAIIGITPISTSIDLLHIVSMGALIGLAVVIPYVVTRYVYKEKIIRFPLGRHTWTRGHLGYLLLALALSYLILPYWMQSTGAYQNWSVVADPYHLFVLFLGTNGLGIWDELFFIVTVLALLKRHVPFHLANMIQAVLFTSFLYELGFRGWAPLVIYPFALLQGLVFRKTDNLTYIIAIHLTIDFILYLALINAHYPHLINIFVTR